MQITIPKYKKIPGQFYPLIQWTKNIHKTYMYFNLLLIISATSFPGSLILPPPEASEERPSPQGAVSWETLGTRLVYRLLMSQYPIVICSLLIVSVYFFALVPLTKSMTIDWNRTPITKIDKIDQNRWSQKLCYRLLSIFDIIID